MPCSRSTTDQIPLMEWYRRHPNDAFLLPIAVGAQSGQLSNIDASGAPSMYFHAMPHILEHDPYSGDFGLGFFGISLEASATLVVGDGSEPPRCYLCDLNVTAAAATAIVGKAATVGAAGRASKGAAKAVYVLRPRDAYRQRVYLEPLGLFLQADAGVFRSVTLDLDNRRITVQFQEPTQTPAGFQSYSALRLRVDKVSREEPPASARPGRDFAVTAPAGAKRVRAAWEVPLTAAGGGSGSPPVVVITWAVE
jgi:hypothetical protein